MTTAQSFITLTYLIETAGNPEALAAKIASDQSTGTFVAVPGETEDLKNGLPRRGGGAAVPAACCRAVLSVRRAGALPSGGSRHRLSLRGHRHRPAALMTIAIGGVYSIRGFTGIRIVDMKLPEAFGKAWPGRSSVLPEPAG